MTEVRVQPIPEVDLAFAHDGGEAHDGSGTPPFIGPTYRP